MTPQQLTHRLNEAIAHHKAGRLDRAEAIYKQLAPVAPKLTLLFDLWGQLAEQQGRAEDAIRYYGQACRIEESSAALAMRLTSAYIAAGRAAEAERFLRRALLKNEKCAEMWNALGFTLKILGRIPEALGCHERAVTIDPKYVEGWVHFGLTFGLVGKGYHALQHYERALALDPNCVTARYGRAETLHKVYRLDEAIAEYDAYLKMVPDNLEARSYRLFALQNLDTITPAELFAEHCAYGDRVGTGPKTLPGYDLSAERPLRVAILSPDLRTHSCAFFLEPLLRHLDRTQFEIYLYHDHFLEDTMSARLRGLAAKWRNFVGQPHHVVERIVRADKPDVLIDLTGHIGNTIRLPILAKRLAPVQITYLGYPDTTGVPAMDFRFTDAVADPVGDSDAYATEKLVRFAPVAWTYQPPLDAPPVAPLPSLKSGRITYGCFNSPTKFTRSLYRAWTRLLERVPNARLLIKGRDFEELQVRENVLSVMRECGVPLDRIDLVPRTATTADHLAQYANVDIALDTFPYNGTTTTCEALWMGRPVVTLRGERHASRVGASLLSAVGHPEWIAASADDYVEVAARLAADAEIAAQSTSLRAQMQSSALLDHAGQSARFGAGIRECWRRKTGAGKNFPSVEPPAERSMVESF